MHIEGPDHHTSIASLLPRRCVRRLGSFLLALTLAPLVVAQTPFHFPANGAVAGAPQSATVSVVIAAAGTVSAVEVLTQGASNLDYTLASGGTCANGAYAVGQTCTATVTFLPRYPGRRQGAVVLVASDQTVLGTAFLEGAATGSLSVLVPGQITTVAGDTSWIYSGDNVPATASALFLPMGEVTDGAGNLYISDTNNNRVRRVDAGTGTITTVAGGSQQGYAGDGGSGVAASLSSPTALALDGAGNLYIADSGNYAVRLLSTVSGLITTVAGGRAGSGGDGGPAISAQLSAVNGLALDGQYGLLLADTGNNAIRRVDLGSGVITRFAGTGAAGYSGDNHAALGATFNTVQGIACGDDGSVYVADMNNNVVRRIDAGGTVTTVAGGGSGGLGDGGTAVHASLQLPAAVAVDQAANLYIADAANNRIRKVNGGTSIITTLAGNGNEAFAGDDGPADQAQFYGPYSLFYDGEGDLFVGDMFHNRVRRINGSLAALKFNPIRVNRVSPPQLETIENDGNAALTLAAPAFVQATLDATTTTCDLPSTGPMALSASCVLGVAFAPTILGSNVAGSLTLSANAADSPAVVSLSGQVLSVDPTATTIVSSQNPSAFGAAVILTAHVTTEGSGLTGSVQFFDGGTALGSGALNTGHVAVWTTSTLALGLHTLTAVYSGDATNAASTSATLNQAVKQPTAVALLSSANPSLEATPVTLTATLTAGGTMPTGAVSFVSDGVALGTASLNAGGVSTWTVATLAIGSHTITASYAGDTNNSPSVSPGMTQVVAGQTSGLKLMTSNATIPVGSSVTFSAQAIGGSATPTGVVIFKDGANSIGTATLNSSGAANLSTTGLAPGSHTVTVVYAGDTHYAGSTAAALLETVQQLATSVVVAASVNPSPAGAAVILTATISSSGTTGGPIQGSVSFTSGGVKLGTATLGTGGVATLSVAALPLGTDLVSAAYTGSTNYLPSSAAALGVMVVQATSTTMLATSMTPSIAEDTVLLTATVTSNGGRPTGLVTFADGGAAIGTAILDGGGVAALATSQLIVGRHAITASYGGDTQTTASASAMLAQTVLLRPTGDVLTSSATSLNGGQQVTLISVVQWTGALAPTGTAIFQTGGTVLGAAPVDGAGVAALTINPQPGMTSVIAHYSGDATFAGSSSVAINVPLGIPPQFTMEASQTALTMRRLQHTTVDVTVASEKGFADMLLFGCAGLPVAATCTFSQDQLSLTADGGGRVHVVVDTGSPLTAGSVATREAPPSRDVSLVTRCGLSAGALLCLLLWRMRRLRSLGASVLLLASLGLTGCGTITIAGTPVGAYHFQITAAAQGAGVLQAVNMTLTVTP